MIPLLAVASLSSYCKILYHAASPSKDDWSQQKTLLQQEIPGVWMVNATTNQKHNTTLRQPHIAVMGTLRHDWSHHYPLLSTDAKMIEAAQTNCTSGIITNHLDNEFGIGSNVGRWSQSMCHALVAGVRLRTHNPTWLWLDQTVCDLKNEAVESPWLCYLPRAEARCRVEDSSSAAHEEQNLTVDPGNRGKYPCSWINGKGAVRLKAFRAGSTEYMFQSISPVVIAEAQRQVGLLFGRKTPDNLVTVHIRWGDKHHEMDLVNITSYVRAVSELLMEAYGHNRTANIYVATEDPVAAVEFKKAVPDGWNVFCDRTVEELSDFRPVDLNGASYMSKNTKGRAGLVGFGSLLVALEARLFVLTSKSNWSRLMDQLRMNIIDPRCNSCTKKIDLRPGMW